MDRPFTEYDPGERFDVDYHLGQSEREETEMLVRRRFHQCCGAEVKRRQGMGVNFPLRGRGSSQGVIPMNWLQYR